MIDAIILDVDGTLWDSTGVVAGAWTKAAVECGMTDAVITADQLKGLFGKTMDAIGEALFPDTDASTRNSIMDKCCIYEHEAVEANEADITYPGVVDTIRTSEVPMAIVSNCQSGYIELFMKKTGVTSYIKDIECFGNTGEGKASNIKRVVERNGWKHPVYVGDTAGDLEACREAGVPFIWASYGFGLVDPRDALAVADEFAEVWDVVRYSA
ncbi:MAG: HAD family hydrolase [Lachnospiraceae bacterium]|nr:HAD family hydrolase [Lachnospiraceae bacterium]